MRGTAAGESVVSQAGTEEFRSGYERVFGERKPQRGRWVWDEAQGKLVSASEYRPPELAMHAPLMIDTFMDGDRAQDGTDISSRAKRREYMRREGVADASDYKFGYGERRRAAKERDLDASTNRVVAELAKTDVRNLPNAVEQLRRKG